MRFMIQVRATAVSERGDPPGPDYAPLFQEMGAFHEEMARAGVLLDGAGLRPSRDGWRLRYRADGSREPVDGPFAETKELIAGYTLIQVRSEEEARAWASRFPMPFVGIDCEIEVRRLYEDADFAPGGDMAVRTE
ncbi:YciI family protein [Roseateles cellulosilyticus]|uniref:YciI family protein n=1 Tax=Pelomonas cellulosilytica TaxID=2906762 RepID=A0ABS8XYC6_9BURK|nr:YciI family protein [Pelomonas sp. P8]MCE4555621.1 YciI family protein [Pelomonas sp. P8]